MGPTDANLKGGAQPPNAPKRRALLVNEDPGDLRYYSDALERCGYQVRACSSYRQGVCCLGSEVFDFVMVSQGSSNFEGRCVLERAVEIDRRLRVVVVARYVDMCCYLEAMQLGAVDYLAEPVPVSEVIRLVRDHPRGWRSAGY